MEWSNWSELKMWSLWRSVTATSICLSAFHPPPAWLLVIMMIVPLLMVEPCLWVVPKHSHCCIHPAVFWWGWFCLCWWFGPCLWIVLKHRHSGVCWLLMIVPLVIVWTLFVDKVQTKKNNKHRHCCIKLFVLLHIIFWPGHWPSEELLFLIVTLTGFVKLTLPSNQNSLLSKVIPLTFILEVLWLYDARSAKSILRTLYAQTWKTICTMKLNPTILRENNLFSDWNDIHQSWQLKAYDL